MKSLLDFTPTTSMPPSWVPCNLQYLPQGNPRTAREDRSVESSLLALPDPCLLTVLQCCAANEQRSLFSAARAHSRLRTVAVLALASISVSCTQQQQADRALMFLGQHGKQVDRIHLEGSIQYKTYEQRAFMDLHGRVRFEDDCRRTPQHAVTLHQLPTSLQPSSLTLIGLGLQLQPNDCFRGVLGAAAGVAALQRLELSNCTFLDGDEGLTAALSRLPAGLEHLCIMFTETKNKSLSLIETRSFPASLLQRLQHLTYLEFGNICLLGDNDVGPALQAMTRLVDLRVSNVTASKSRKYYGGTLATVDVLSRAPHLTRLALSDCSFKAGALAHQTRLRHLDMRECSFYSAASAANFLDQELPNLQHMPHLTHLRLADNLVRIPAAAFTALTANRNLLQLDISGCTLPDGAWQYMFPVEGLPNLQELNISHVKQAYWRGQEPGWPAAAPPDSCRLVNCCPGLLSLEMQGLRGNSDQLGRDIERLRVLAREQAAIHAERVVLALQVPDLLSEVEHLRHQVSQQQLLQQQLTAAQGAAAEAQQTVAVLQLELAAARAAAATAAATNNGAAAAEASAKQWQQEVPNPFATAPSADSDDVASVRQVWLSGRASESPV